MRQGGQLRPRRRLAQAGEVFERPSIPGCASPAPEPPSRSLPQPPERFLTLAPRVASFAVAVHLIFVALVGSNGIHHIMK
jgi:hypothetical protein